MSDKEKIISWETIITKNLDGQFKYVTTGEWHVDPPDGFSSPIYLTHPSTFYNIDAASTAASLQIDREEKAIRQVIVRVVAKETRDLYA